ncbi:molybdopterin-guanine dinucleotide biosynthesis protein B [Gracilibacillus sp. HCP3S3_G5_1]|uniref:molybdopterin-guanine dinucleotide biosynthesis protein B n=1 Tax=unclassified Gracilibacillus TaxID=2625209 RepID=UPI003F8CD414
MFVVQVVGYKNSGKTTFMTQWINYLTEKGYQVATVKHHGHGGEPDQLKGTDSYQHFEAGAKLSTVVGDSQLIMTADKRKFSLKALLLLYQSIDIDIVLIEGYKQIPLPKIVLLKKDDHLLLESVENVKYVYQDNAEYAEQLFYEVEANWSDFDFENVKTFL